MNRVRAIEMRLRQEESFYFHYMNDGADLRRPYSTWTDAQVIARCRNLAEQRQRRLAHDTGALS